MTGMICGLARWLWYALCSVYLAYKNWVGDKGTRPFSFSFFQGSLGYISNQALSLFSFFIFPANTHHHNTTVGDGPKQSTSTSWRGATLCCGRLSILSRLRWWSCQKLSANCYQYTRCFSTCNSPWALTAIYLVLKGQHTTHTVLSIFQTLVMTPMMTQMRTWQMFLMTMDGWSRPSAEGQESNNVGISK